eukprot:CAMPEP_0172444150 /NCGR_PEP_ID=MMETSP1065-20121228/4239_1 /TAXON_ID=265537 /ORGANISM="Amphiprora paludosa, Strain CCMP125" /LENGTH=230 /DNA_ID=CAMNT_0013194573 /DNA_START=40 /DNA_END=732 /DNA_ORIENTATION=+
MALAGVAIVAPAVDARHYAGGLLAPQRRYLYNRSPATRRGVSSDAAFDMAFDLLRTPIYAANSMLRQSEAAFDQLTQHAASSSPRYAVTEDPQTGTMELTMEVPGVSAQELVVEVEDNSLLRIQGSRNVNYYGQAMQTEFDRSFKLDDDIDVSSLKVTLNSGILTVTGQKKEKIVQRLDIATAPRVEEKETITVEHKTTSEVEGAEEETKKEEDAEETPDGLTITTEEET